MKNTLFFICFICFFSILRAQHADEKLKALLNKQDYFTLMEIYPSIKDSLQSEGLKHTAEFFLHLHFNQPKEMLKDFNVLLTNHKAEIKSLIPTLFLYESIYWFNEGEYKYAIERLNNYLTHTEELTDDEQVSFAYYQLLANLLKDIPKHEIVRPKKDAEVPIKFEQIGDGCLMKIPVNVNENENDFILDTGSPFNYVSESFAIKNGIRILPDSIPIYGINMTLGKIGVADSILIGNIIFRNPFFLVVPEKDSDNSTHSIDAILGLHFMRMMKEIRIYPQKQQIVFPEKQTGQLDIQPNLLLKNSHLFVKAYNNNDRLIFLLDSGHTKANMTLTFYEKRKAWIHLAGTDMQIGIDGVGGRRFVDANILPSFSIEMANRECKLTSLPVYTNTALSFNETEDGVLGMDFFMQWKEININFVNMCIEIR